MRGGCRGAVEARGEWVDWRTGPGEGRVWYYLVRARNTCGEGSFGNSGLFPDPRDGLDVAVGGVIPCP